jgi:hypothetical protein
VGKLIDLVNKYRGQLKNRTKQNKSPIKSRGLFLLLLGRPFDVAPERLADEESKGSFQEAMIQSN